mgnify:CR=1 FL=1
MKDLFMKILLSLVGFGNLTEANLYSSGKYATLTIETESGKYDIAIMKKDEE